ncbi:MAG: ATP-binding protein [Tepidisphaeraceae bacterium]|jgi:signal transduction histidine kinase
MTTIAEISLPQPRAKNLRVEDLGEIIREYNKVTERLQESHVQLEATVQALRNELSEKNQQLARRQRLAALGEMAAGMAHEIRNPLGGIQLYASMLAKDLTDSPQLLQLVNKISTGVKSLDALVDQVLHFTREIRANPADCDLADVVNQAIELAGHRLAGILCRTSGPRPMAVRVDRLLLGRAILNLLINAAEAMNEKSRKGKKGAIKISWSASGDGHFRMSIADEGPGIPAQVMDRIFNPFFTTRESGTGLGLAIVHRIVEAHEGTITVTNRSGGGAVFELRI